MALSPNNQAQDLALKTEIQSQSQESQDEGGRGLASHVTE